MTLWRRLLDLPFLVILMGLAAVAMLLPAGHALALRQLPVARAFFYSSLIFLILTAMIAIATAGYRARNQLKSQLVAVVGAYAVLPLILAVPFQQAMPGLSFVDAWFEMLSCFTTTGATLFDNPDVLAPPLHFWRAFVGWFGGFFIVLSILAVLAPLGLGGGDLTGGAVQDSRSGGTQITRSVDTPQRMMRYAVLLFPPYAAMTALLWVGLLLSGDSALIAMSHAMGALSTSGISPVAGLQGTASGRAGEALIFVFLWLAVTRRFWPRSLFPDRTRTLLQDPELQLALLLLALASLVLVMRDWVQTTDAGLVQTLSGLLGAVWGAGFTLLSFLTTTGFQSADWTGLNAPGVILLGVAIMGGGAATAAGGVKLLRVYALLRHGERELERIVHPHSIGGHGPVARRLRREGAYLTWIFFMIFGLLIAAVTAALTLTGQGFEQALVFAVASITTTGQLAMVSGDAPLSYASLGTAAKAILGSAMILGRLEILAVLAILLPKGWDR